MSQQFEPNASLVGEQKQQETKASSSSAPEQPLVPKLKSQINKQKLQMAIKDHFPPNHALWRDVFSFLDCDDLFFGVGCVCKCWKENYLNPMIRNLLIMFNRNLQSYCENNQMNESSRERLAFRNFIEMWKEYIKLLIINDLSQILRLNTRKLLLLNYNIVNNQEDSKLFEKFANELCDKERVLPITTKKEYTTMSMELRNILIGKDATNNSSNSFPIIDNSITIKPVTSSTSSYSITVDENPNEEKTGLLNSYKKVRISNFEIQNKVMIELLDNQWKQYFSRFVWNHQRPSMLQKTDLSSGEVILDSDQGEKSVGIIQTILNMFGCNFENDLSVSNESFSSSLSMSDSSVNVLNISLFINGEFGNFIADGYTEVGFDFMERTFKIGKQVYQCKLNLCAGSKRFISGGLVQTKNSDYVILCTTNSDLTQYEYFDAYDPNPNTEYLMVHLKTTLSKDLTTEEVERMRNFSRTILKCPFISMDKETFGSNTPLMYCLILHHCLKNQTFSSRRK